MVDNASTESLVKNGASLQSHKLHATFASNPSYAATPLSSKPLVHYAFHVNHPAKLSISFQHWERSLHHGDQYMVALLPFVSFPRAYIDLVKYKKFNRKYCVQAKWMVETINHIIENKLIKQWHYINKDIIQWHDNE